MLISYSILERSPEVNTKNSDEVRSCAIVPCPALNFALLLLQRSHSVLACSFGIVEILHCITCPRVVSAHASAGNRTTPSQILSGWLLNFSAHLQKILELPSLLLAWADMVLSHHIVLSGPSPNSHLEVVWNFGASWWILDNLDTNTYLRSGNSIIC